MAEKLTLFRVQDTTKQSIVSARIEAEPYSKLEKLSEETGISICKLTTMCINFAAARVEVKDLNDEVN